MPVLIGTLLAILVIAVVLYPFLGRRLRPRPTADSRDRSGGGGPESIYEEIKTLQLEYDLGAVEEEEYRKRLHAYRLRAAAALRDREEREGASEGGG